MEHESTTIYTRTLNYFSKRETWGVYEHGTDRLIAVCPTLDDAERVKAALVHNYNDGLTVHLHVDGREIAKTVVPHIADHIRVSSGIRNF